MFMFEKAFAGGRKYWCWLLLLILLMGLGLFFYLRQIDQGLGITGLSRDVTWGLYIAQFTFLAGIAASTVAIVLPFYLYDYRPFGRIVVLAELLAMVAITMGMLFILVDLGQPMRLPNILLHPAPASIMFWDMICMVGYLALNAVIALFTVRAERTNERPPIWIKLLILISIPWAVGMRTVSELLYSGLPGRSFWLTAILPPRALASALAAGPALLILLCLVLRTTTGFDAGKPAVQKLAQIAAYATAANLFFLLMEIFTAFYSRVPEHMESFVYLFVGLNGHNKTVPWIWASVLMAVTSVILLLTPRARQNERVLTFATALVLASMWIDRGIGQILGGFVPSPLGAVTEYTPTLEEFAVALGIWAMGFLLLTVFYRITLSVREAAP
jgi:Ni/Fe-hydrogenase subunit HybB-like protein